MTVDAATLTSSVVSGVATLSWILPAGASQDRYRALVYRQSDIPFEGGGPTHTPVAGTRRNTVPYGDRLIEGFWVVDDTARSLTLNDFYPSEAYLGNGSYTARMWWAGSQPGVTGNDIISRPAETDFSVSGSSYPVVMPGLLRRVNLEQGYDRRVRVDVFPAPTIVYPTEAQAVDLSTAMNMRFDFDIPSDLPARYFKLAVYREQDVEGPNYKTRRPMIYTDDGEVPHNPFAEWVLLSLGAQRISGASSGFQRYRCTFAQGGLNNGRVPNGRFIAYVRYADAREGNYRSSENDGVFFVVSGSNAPALPVLPIVFDAPVFLTKPTITAAAPNPIFVVQDDNWTLRYRYISNEGLSQTNFEARYNWDQTKATSFGLPARGYSDISWSDDDGERVFQGWQTAIDNNITTQDLPIRGNPATEEPSDSNRAPDTRIAFTESLEDGLERRYFNFQFRALDAAGNWSDWNDGESGRPDPLRAYYYRRLRASRLSATVVDMPLTQRAPSFTAGRATNGYVSIEVDVSHISLGHQQDTGNWPAQIKVAWYRQQDVDSEGEPLQGVRPFAYTSDYFRYPGAPDESVEFAASRTGAEWVDCASVLSSQTGNNVFQSVRDTGTTPLRWGEYIEQGGKVETKTFGGIPSGSHLVRIDVRDIHGSRASETLVQFVTVSINDVRDVLCAARAYDRRGRVVLTEGGEEVVRGVVPGAYIGVGFTEVADSSKGLASFVEVERREVTEEGEAVDGTHVLLPGRVRPNSSGTFPEYRDYLTVSGRRYQYRCRSVRNPGAEAYSEWRPT